MKAMPPSALIPQSLGSAGDSYDNALAETINGLYKAEVIHRRGPWRSFEAVEYATLEWVDWFNHRRLQKPIGSIPPAESLSRNGSEMVRWRVFSSIEAERPSGP